MAGVSIILPSISEAGEESAASSTCGVTTRGEEPIELSVEQQKLAKELTSLSGEVISSSVYITLYTRLAKVLTLLSGEAVT